MPKTFDRKDILKFGEASGTYTLDGATNAATALTKMAAEEEK